MAERVYHPFDVKVVLDPDSQVVGYVVKDAGDDRTANALMRASNDIVSTRAGRLVATPRLSNRDDAERVAQWLRRLAEVYRTEGW